MQNIHCYNGQDPMDVCGRFALLTKSITPLGCMTRGMTETYWVPCQSQKAMQHFCKYQYCLEIET